LVVRSFMLDILSSKLDGVNRVDAANVPNEIHLCEFADVTITIRALESDEWEQFRDVRLAALKAVPGVYGTRYEDAASRTEAAWRGTVKGPSNQSFGLFDGQTLVGITSVFTWEEDPTGQTAILASSFIEDSYRGQRLSRMLYDIRIAWIKEHGQFTRIVVGHRASNEPSRRANQHYGFAQFRRAPHVWPDGTTEHEIFYEMKIEP
jgi:RimJ/RimL family protein N-acetyltransferase